jgi:hypothetical protein
MNAMTFASDGKGFYSDVARHRSCYRHAKFCSTQFTGIVSAIG